MTLIRDRARILRNKWNRSNYVDITNDNNDNNNNNIFNGFSSFSRASDLSLNLNGISQIIANNSLMYHYPYASYMNTEETKKDVTKLLNHALRHTKSPVIEEVDGLKCKLYQHQQRGLGWLYTTEEDKKQRGGFLCDQMGVGKTIQMYVCKCKTISFLFLIFLLVSYTN